MPNRKLDPSAVVSTPPALYDIARAAEPDGVIIGRPKKLFDTISSVDAWTDTNGTMTCIVCMGRRVMVEEISVLDAMLRTRFITL